jgi:hypothetical protein
VIVTLNTSPGGTIRGGTANEFDVYTMVLTTPKFRLSKTVPLVGCWVIV